MDADPSNVRQLLDTVQSLFDMTPSSYISRTQVGEYLKSRLEEKSNGQSLADILKDYKKTVIIQTLVRHDYNASAAARELQVDPANFHKMINDLNISKG